MIEQFAKQHRLRVCTDPWDRSNKIILGKYGFIDILHRSGSFTAVFGYRPKLDYENTSVRVWNNAKNALLAAGCTLYQRGDTEGVFKFDPEDQKQVDAVLQRLGIRRKRKLSEETVERLRRQLRSTKPTFTASPAQERGFADSGVQGSQQATHPTMISETSFLSEREKR